MRRGTKEEQDARLSDVRVQLDVLDALYQLHIRIRATISVPQACIRCDEGTHELGGSCHDRDCHCKHDDACPHVDLGVAHSELALLLLDRGGRVVRDAQRVVLAWRVVQIYPGPDVCAALSAFFARFTRINAGPTTTR